MKIAVIDIGSNSVRLLMWADGKSLYKRMRTTRLGEGLNFSPYLREEAVERTAQAVADFVKTAREDGAEKVYAFATAAVRSSRNPSLFIGRVQALCGLSVEVLSGEREAEISLSGALRGKDGAVIDVGGASTEVTARVGGQVVYTHSANIGTVRILDGAGRDIDKIKDFIAERIGEYGCVKPFGCPFYAVGGTATRLASVKHGLKEYNPQITDGTVLSAEEVLALAEKLIKLPVEQIRRETICSASADLIGGGAMLMYCVMKKFAVKEITVSESDNLEGYALTVGG